MATTVLDASAVLALLFGEAGTETVEDHLDGAAISAVNVAEVAARLADHAIGEAETRSYLNVLAIPVVDFDEELAYSSGQLRQDTRQHGLSLGDRACLALAIREGVPAITADRAWAELDLSVEVVVIR